MNVIFFGSSSYSIPLLDALFTRFHLAAIITQPDKPVGRKHIVTPSPVKKFASDHNIPVFTPPNKNELLKLDARRYFLDADIAVVADYGLIIPNEIFSLPKHGTVNIHFSKLPELRGASPVQYTILQGAQSAWITIQQLSERLDEGDILLQKEFLLDGTETTETLYTALFKTAAKHLPDVIEKYTEEKIKPKRQNDSQATYTRRLTKEDGFIPFEVLKEGVKKIKKDSLLFTALSHTNHVGIAVDRMLRAFTPWPGIWTTIRITNNKSRITEERRLKILSAHIGPKTKDQRLTTNLILDTVQLEGKNPVTWSQFQHAYRLEGSDP